ncbi:Aurachin B dehydrogenase [subsurface metagenome]
MTTAVTGASGHIGGNLIRALLEQGRTVRALAREDRQALHGLDVEIIEGDLFDKESLIKLINGAETVFHLAGRISIIGSEGGLVEKTNIEGTRNVVESCLQCGVKRLVHFSSIHAFSSYPANQVIDESRGPAVGSKHMPYDRSKAGGQIEVLEGVKRGLNAVIVNPGAVIGPNDFKVSRMGEVILDIYHRRLPALIDGGYNWVDVRDVVAGALAAEKKGRTGECYLLTGHWVHLRDLAALVAKITGGKTPRLSAPLWLAVFASYFSLVWARVRNRAPKFTPAAVKSVQMHRHISHQKATDELGYNPRPFEETIRDTLDWFKKAGMLEW